LDPGAAWIGLLSSDLAAGDDLAVGLMQDQAGRLAVDYRLRT
jgi:hypothetical protein